MMAQDSRYFGKPGGDSEKMSLTQRLTHVSNRLRNVKRDEIMALAGKAGTQIAVGQFTALVTATLAHYSGLTDALGHNPVGAVAAVLASSAVSTVLSSSLLYGIKRSVEVYKHNKEINKNLPLPRGSALVINEGNREVQYTGYELREQKRYKFSFKDEWKLFREETMNLSQFKEKMTARKWGVALSAVTAGTLSFLDTDIGQNLIGSVVNGTKSAFVSTRDAFNQVAFPTAPEWMVKAPQYLKEQGAAVRNSIKEAFNNFSFSKFIPKIKKDFAKTGDVLQKHVAQQPVAQPQVEPVVPKVDPIINQPVAKPEVVAVPPETPKVEVAKAQPVPKAVELPRHDVAPVTKPHADMHHSVPRKHVLHDVKPEVTPVPKADPVVVDALNKLKAVTSQQEMNKMYVQERLNNLLKSSGIEVPEGATIEEMAAKVSNNPDAYIKGLESQAPQLTADHVAAVCHTSAPESIGNSINVPTQCINLKAQMGGGDIVIHTNDLNPGRPEKGIRVLYRRLVGSFVGGNSGTDTTGFITRTVAGPNGAARSLHLESLAAAPAVQ